MILSQQFLSAYYTINYKKPTSRKSVTEDEENVFAVIDSVIENPNNYQKAQPLSFENSAFPRTLWK
ncbi:hypothetical protein D910_00511 [Dendroctonus ponderosae]|uniref:Uncharacterized protein n=1 Tax=Dendroctonus ponderosae TaxID=77166 RepID=U4UZP0_DENPD|nr:hypothetical protein D910_00511 [Dendroctonus ponderosae]